MGLSCSYVPYNKEGKVLKGFSTYREELGYEIASKVFPQVLAPSFQNKYKSKLVLDDQNVPTYASAVTVPHIRKEIGVNRLIQSEQKKFSYISNTRENYRGLIQSALTYNTTSDMRDLLTAVVMPSEDGKIIRLAIVEKNEASDRMFQNQYGVSKLNDRLVELFGNLGVTVDLLESNEQSNGHVDFSKASSIADGFKGLVNIANNMQGELALSEEFAHTLIGMFRDEPLIQRSLRQLADNDNLLREVLGDEYQANVDYYTAHPNHDVAGNEVPLNETLAEEALGKILQEKLKNQTTPTTESNSSMLNTLVNRLINFIKKMFKGRNADDVKAAKNEVDASMGDLAKEVLSGDKELKQEQLLKAQRDAKFHQVRENTDKVIKLLENAENIERKRTKIAPKDEVSDIKQRIIKLEALTNDRDKLIGVHTYAKWALADLNNAMNNLDVASTLEQKDFKKLRHIKAVLDSYSGFIDEFHEVLDEIGDLAVITVDGQDVNLNDLWRDINDLYKSCTTTFKQVALSSFSDFLAPMYERSPLRDKDGNIRSLEDVLVGEDFDISEFDRWVTSMGNSSSVILQMFDLAVKNAKDDARLKTIKNIRDIWKIRADAENRGITDLDYIYEKDKDGHKTGNYISEYNQGQYEKDKAEMEKQLIEKYGKNPIGADYVKADRERKAWYKSHAKLTVFGIAVPNESYRNPEYDRLSTAQKDVLNDILQYKTKIERKLPRDRRNTLRAIQRRRSGYQRVFDAISDPGQAYESAKEALKDSFNRNEDDDQLFGDRTSGLTDFTGQEYLTIPVLYTNRLKNPDELSTDIFGDLMVYTYMANSYEEVSKIYDTLEIGSNVLMDKQFVKNSGSKLKEEVINAMGKVTRQSIKIGDNTAFAKKLRDFLECQVYGIYMKEEGEVLGMDVQKTVGTFQKMTSMAYLGCNYLAGVANVATAVGMQNIEAAARRHFGFKELAKADKTYAAMMPAFMAELCSREKQSELALFDELFDVRQNAKDKVHNVQKKSLLQRFFGQNWLFIQQGMGDHWIYNRTAIAMAMKKQVLVDGKKMSVWDARQIVTDPNGYKRMIINPKAMELDSKGNVIGKFDSRIFGRQIAHINHTIAGIYNDEDQNAANRVMVGRLAQQMRKWIIPQFMRRFQGKRPNIIMGEEEEGYYITMFTLAKDVWKSGFKITAEWDKLSEPEKANIHMALAEMGQTLSIFLLVNFLATGSKDPDRSWAMKFAEYMANRELHELGFLTPSPWMLTEGYKTITSPFVAASAANKVAQAILTTMNPFNWFPDDDELIQSGRYEGHSYIYKRWAELPLPPFTQIRQIEKFFDELDTGTKYYSRDYK